MNAPTVSIVLPTYNGSRYLGDAIDSCLAQTFTDWELIIVDDCSTDATPGIAADYAARDSRIKLIRNPVNRKLPGALNVGFAQANGGLFTWISDDNIFLPDALAVMVDAFASRERVDVVYHDYDLIDGKGKVTGRFTTCPADWMPWCNPINSCFMYRRAVHDALGGFDESLFLVEDYDFWMRAYSAGFRFYRSDKVVYRFRMHETSLTCTRQAEIRRLVANIQRAQIGPLLQRWRRDHVEWLFKCADQAGDVGATLVGCRCLLMAAVCAPGWLLDWGYWRRFLRLGRMGYRQGSG